MPSYHLRQKQQKQKQKEQEQEQEQEQQYCRHQLQEKAKGGEGRETPLRYVSADISSSELDLQLDEGHRIEFGSIFAASCLGTQSCAAAAVSAERPALRGWAEDEEEARQGKKIGKVVQEESDKTTTTKDAVTTAKEEKEEDTMSKIMFAVSPTTAATAATALAAVMAENKNAISDSSSNEADTSANAITTATAAATTTVAATTVTAVSAAGSTMSTTTAAIVTAPSAHLPSSIELVTMRLEREAEALLDAARAYSHNMDNTIKNTITITATDTTNTISAALCDRAKATNIHYNNVPNSIKQSNCAKKVQKSESEPESDTAAAAAASMAKRCLSMLASMHAHRPVLLNAMLALTVLLNANRSLRLIYTAPVWVKSLLEMMDAHNSDFVVTEAVCILLANLSGEPKLRVHPAFRRVILPCMALMTKYTDIDDSSHCSYLPHLVAAGLSVLRNVALVGAHHRCLRRHGAIEIAISALRAEASGRWSLVAKPCSIGAKAWALLRNMSDRTSIAYTAECMSLDFIIEQLDAHSPHPHTLQHMLPVLTRLRGFPPDPERLQSSGTLVLSMLNNEDIVSDPELARHAVMLLRNLTLEVEGRGRVFGNSLLATVLRLAARHDRCAGTQEQIFGLLRNFSLDQDSRPLIVKAGALRACASMMALHADVAGVQEQATVLFRNLSLVSSVRDSIFATLGHLRVIEAMKSHPRREQVQLQCCVVARNLTLSLEHRVRMDAAGIIEPVITAMSDFPGSAGIQEQGVCVLRNMTLETKTRTAVRVAGGLKALLYCMRSTEDDVEIQKHACATFRNLTLDADQRAPLCREALPDLLHSVECQRGHNSVQVHACAALRNLALEEETREYMCAVGTIEVLVQTLKSARGHAEVTQHSGHALHSLARGTDYENIQAMHFGNKAPDGHRPRQRWEEWEAGGAIP